MAREFAKEFYSSRAWRRVRAAYIAHREAIDGGICEVCQQEPGLIVHHITWLDESNVNDIDVALDMNNLRFECQTCHNREQDPKKPRPARRYLIGPDGELLPVPAE